MSIFAKLRIAQFFTHKKFRWNNSLEAQSRFLLSHLYVIKIVNFAQKLAQQIFLSLNLKTPFGSSEGQISRL